MAGGANINAEILAKGGTHLEGVAAGALNGNKIVCRVNIFFHGKPHSGCVAIRPLSRLTPHIVKVKVKKRVA